MPDPADWFVDSRDLLRPALEHAVAVARSGARERPPIDPPPSLVPLLRFTSLRGPALDVVAAALDDDGFRERVRADAPTDVASVLFLERPDGWTAALPRLARVEREVIALRSAEPESRRIQKRLAAAEAARSSAEAESADARAALDEARDALASERERRRTAEATVHQHVRVIDRGARAADEQAAAVAHLQADLEASHEQVRSLRASATQDDSVDVASVRAALAGVRAMVDDARAAIGAVESRLDVVERAVPAPPASHPDDPSERSPRPERSPLPIPPGLVAESTSAAQHLVRAPRVVVLVDGYNVTIGRWGQHLGITEQRDRLERAASSAAARTGADVWIVFDGADVESRAGSPRSLVRVQFSESGEEADDVIIRLVSQIPSARPVVVVSDDNRVRRGAVAGGANLFTVEQFLGVCGLEP